MFYRGSDHKRLYAAVLKDLRKPIYQMTPEFLSALFLLTADNKLWNQSKNAIRMNEIEFTKIHLAGTSADGYTLCKTAQDLYEGTSHI